MGNICVVHHRSKDPMGSVIGLMHLGWFIAVWFVVAWIVTNLYIEPRQPVIINTIATPSSQS